ncbi:MAG: hypothetical protein KAS32_07215 [Candidatus Peribacteraceae bacterium]|nr:hypothetical protein [Candidatus Peribacteraceae bacterium]
MTESDYLKATNATKMAIIIKVLADILPGYGISVKETQEIGEILYKAHKKISASYTLEQDPTPGDT